MASLNDNLFTTITHDTSHRDFCCLIQTRWGPLKVTFGQQGPTELSFDATNQPKTENDSVFRAAFLEWLRAYQSVTADEQWLNLAVEGSDFQKTVWRALLDIPFGEQATYQDIAKHIGQDKASRAVGSAIARNRLALLIPCHRIVPSSGGTGNYRWGANRKCDLLEAEQAQDADLYHFFL